MHDKNGKSIKIGDTVSVTGKIVETLPTEDFCHLKVEVPAMHPRVGTEYTWWNAKQTELVIKS